MTKNLVAIIIGATVALSSAHGAKSTSPSNAAKLTCLKARQDSQSARAAKDLEAQEEFSKISVQKCANMFDNERLADAYEDLAFIALERKQSENALKAAQSCITAVYDNTSCHLHKAQALSLLWKNRESLKSLNSTKLLIEHKTRRVRNQMEAGATMDERTSLQSTIDLLDTQAQFVDLLIKEQDTLP